jgi:hypothetical protein
VTTRISPGRGGGRRNGQIPVRANRNAQPEEDHFRESNVLISVRKKREREKRTILGKWNYTGEGKEIMSQVLKFLRLCLLMFLV